MLDGKEVVAKTTAFNNCYVSNRALHNENVLASTLGHENVHGGQSWAFRLSYPNEAEMEAYRWEINNVGLTGILASYKQLLQEWYDYYAGDSPDPPKG